jgi:outer membrane protein assembly factor BamB
MKFGLSQLLLLTLAVHTAALAADWPRWRGPEASGVSAETVVAWPAGGPKKLWQAEVGTGFSAITVSAGRLFTMGFGKAQDHVSCLDTRTGDLLWKFSQPGSLMPNLYEGGPNATPTVDGGKVFTFTRRGMVHALEAATGKVLWSKDVAKVLGARMPEWGFSGSPLVEGGVLVLNCGSAGVGLDKSTGAILWHSSSTGAGALAGYATPVPFNSQGRRLVAIFAARELVAVDPQSGVVAWRHPWKTDYDVNAADPVVVGDRVLISSGYGRGAAVLQVGSAGPRAVWENKNLRAHFMPPVAVGGFVFGADGNTIASASLRCLDLTTGDIKWSSSGIGVGGLIAAGDKLIVLTSRGELLLVPASSSEFKPLARAQILGGKCWTNPTLSHGRLYARNATGTLVCVELAPQ